MHTCQACEAAPQNPLRRPFLGVPDGNLKIATVAPLIISLCSLSQKVGPIALAVQAVGGSVFSLDPILCYSTCI